MPSKVCEKLIGKSFKSDFILGGGGGGGDYYISYKDIQGPFH